MSERTHGHVIINWVERDGEDYVQYGVANVCISGHGLSALNFRAAGKTYEYGEAVTEEMSFNITLTDNFYDPNVPAPDESEGTG